MSVHCKETSGVSSILRPMWLIRSKLEVHNLIDNVDNQWLSCTSSHYCVGKSPTD